MQEKDVVQQWNDAALYWEKHRAVIERLFAPVTDALVEAAALRPGQVVLDVATGPGEPALSLASLVGPRGRVVGTDVVPAMIDAAGREASRRGLRNVEFRAASAESLPFDPESFDVVVSRFGVMFFPSPSQGIREMLRVLEPGGTLALAVWHVPQQNPFFSLLSDIVERLFEPSPVREDAPEPFRYAQRGKLLDIARRAGLAEAEERLVKFSIEAPVSLETFWTVRTEMSDRLRTKLRELAPSQAKEIRETYLHAARAYANERGVKFPAEVLVVSGRRMRARGGVEPIA